MVFDGEVKSFAEKLTAENTVKAIQGVKAIINEIKVDPSLHYKKTDSEIAIDIINALKSSVWIPAQKIKALVKDRVVTLSEEVEWQNEKTAAFTAVKNLWGIKLINNEITVKPSITINEDKLRQEITKKFERHTGLDASRKNWSCFKYLDLESACFPLTHCNEIPVHAFQDFPTSL